MLRKLIAFSALWIPLPTTLPVRAQDFTLEEVLSAAMPSGLVASLVGGAVAWVRNERGVRNVFAARAPGFRAYPLTSYSEDDGQELGGLQFTPDGQAVVFTRGGAPNRRGQRPNPRSFVEGVEIGTYLVPLEGGEVRKLADRAGLVLAPDGTHAIYASEGAVYRLRLDGTGEPEKLFEVRDGAGSLSFSPDGSRIAFVTRRERHSFVGVWTEDERRIRWLSPGLWSDSDPVWSPDGSRIAFLRTLSRPGDWPFVPVRESVPFSIRVAEVSTGESREVFRAEEGEGSAFHGWSGEAQLLWAAGDRLVFPWEKTGWLNLWSVPAEGGPPLNLTPGEFEVQYGGLTPDRKEILYDSNQGDSDRKHIWRVPVDGSRPPLAVTRGTGIEWAPVMTAEGALAFLASGGTTPAHAEIVIDGERRPLLDSWLPPAFPSGKLVEPEAVVFRASDGLPIHGQLFLPRDLSPGERRPAILFFHGGSRRQMLLGFHPRGYYHNAYAMNQYLASEGYVVLAVNYRSGIGYGLAFREAADYGAAGASEFHDVVGAAAYLRSRPDVDPDRIGLWGGSYGGYLTALGLARASDLFAAGVDLHGVHDWNVVIHGFRPEYDRGQWEEFARRALEASPMADVDRWRSPVLLIHGDDDRNVPFTESVDLAYALARRGVHVEELVFPDEVHGFLLHRNWLEAYQAADDFFRRMLLEGQAARLRSGVPEDVREEDPRIRAVESGLTRSIHVRGEEPARFTLQERMETYHVPGVSIAVLDEGRIVWARGYGVADVETGQPVTPETLFQAASISKPEAAIAALTLVEEGVLELDAPVNRYLRSWKIPENAFTQANPVTLRHLITHTGGLTVHGFPGYAVNETLPSTLEVLDGTGPANTPPIRVDTIPGRLWRYSGGGYTVLQQLLEDVTGRPFPELVRERVLEPAGMTHSTYRQPLPAEREIEAASGHGRDGSRVDGKWHVYPEMAAAGLWTTPSDLARLALTLQASAHGDGGVLSPALTRELLTPGLGGWGLGFQIAGEGSEARFSHGGSNHGFKALFLAYVEGGRGVFIMTNGDRGSELAQEIALAVAREFGFPYPRYQEVILADVSAEVLEGIAGEYRLEEGGGTVRVEVAEGHLRILAPGDQVIEVFPTSEAFFIDLLTGNRFRVERNGNGQVTALAIVGGPRALRVRE